MSVEFSIAQDDKIATITLVNTGGDLTSPTFSFNIGARLVGASYSETSLGTSGSASTQVSSNNGNLNIATSGSTFGRIGSGEPILTVKLEVSSVGSISMSSFSGTINGSNVSSGSFPSLTLSEPAPEVGNFVEGVFSEGSTLSVNFDKLPNWDFFFSESSVEIQWLRNGQPILDATEQTYVLAQEDVGELISARVGYRTNTFENGFAKSFITDPAEEPVVSVKIGSSSDDSLVGTGGPNNFQALAGDDKITGGGANDTIDGGEGIDTATYSSSQSNYTLTIGQRSTAITDRNASEGTDTLINIEKLVFTDRTLDLDNYSSLTQLNDIQFSDLAKVYVAYFNRAADAEGLYFWADKLAEGMDMATIASYFSQSAEAKALYPNTADTSAFVTAVYANVLGRTPDQAGFDFWTTNLNNGSMQPATFVLSIIGGAQGPDITYLSNKADLGVYFAAIKGMSDVADAQNVLNIFGDQATSNTSGAKASVDGHFTDATASGGGEFIFELVGIVNDPFAGVI